MQRNFRCENYLKINWFIGFFIIIFGFDPRCKLCVGAMIKQQKYQLASKWASAWNFQ